jgi:hypothetical protein
MATAKMETAAERYRRIKADKAKNEQLFDVPCECGMEWKCRRVPKSVWIQSGMLPAHLVSVMVETLKKSPTAPANESELLARLTAREIAQSIEFTSKAVKMTAVEPRIVEVVTEPNDISQEEVMMCCYNRLRDWQMQGGDEAKHLDTFPS